jgi:hypothetical protein
VIKAVDPNLNELDVYASPGAKSLPVVLMIHGECGLTATRSRRPGQRSKKLPYLDGESVELMR